MESSQLQTNFILKSHTVKSVQNSTYKINDLLATSLIDGTPKHCNKMVPQPMMRKINWTQK